MKFFFIKLFLILLLTFPVFSNEIKIIELHEIENDVVNNENNEDTVLEDSIFNQNLQESESVETTKEITEEINIVQNDNEESMTVSTLSFWENSNKEDLDFLFSKINKSDSYVMNSYFVNTLKEFSKAPESYTQEEFDNLRINTLIKMGKRKEAIEVLNNIVNSNEKYKNYYDIIKLNYYLTSDELSKACSFKETLQELKKDQNNIILKLSIFCSFLENKVEESNFLNSLLLDTEDKDKYFQKIFFNLKNNINEPIELAEGTYDDSSLALYSAMIRIGSLPFTKKFLEFDSGNLTLPIVLSLSTDISLRLKSAHKAYDLGLFKSESLAALYQSVDFSSKDLNNWEQSILKYREDYEMAMALLFQNASVQLLPITRLESLKEFWEYSAKKNHENLAYSISKNLIESTEPSTELSEYSLLLARANIFNKNFDEAEKWIAFYENHVLKNDQNNLNKVKFLYNLQKSEEKDEFLKNLEENLLLKIQQEGVLEGYSETLKTIFSIIINKEDITNKIYDEKKVLDARLMPSNYIINNIANSSNNNKVGELILTTLVSIDGKSWNDVHPQHLKLILESLKKAKLDRLFKDLILEIFEENEII